MKAIGDALKRAGLTPRGLAAWAGTDRVSMLPLLFERIAKRPRTPAAAALELFVAGREIDAAALAKLGVPVDALVMNGLVARAGGSVRSCVAIVPLGPSLLVCDRDDADVELHLVPFPDDSSHHLAGSIPDRGQPIDFGRPRSDDRNHLGPRECREAASHPNQTWLDLACGSAFSPLARPASASVIRCTDINPRAIRYAQLGAALSGVSLAAAVADVGAPHAPADLITCNAPIPDPTDPVLWRGTDTGFFARLWAAASAPLVIVHAVEDALVEFSARARGERVVAIYTPPTELGFGVLWWRPAAPDRRVVARVELTASRPHVDARVRDELL